MIARREFPPSGGFLLAAGFLVAAALAMSVVSVSVRHTTSMTVQGPAAAPTAESSSMAEPAGVPRSLSSASGDAGPIVASSSGSAGGSGQSQDAGPGAVDGGTDIVGPTGSMCGPRPCPHS